MGIAIAGHSPLMKPLLLAFCIVAVASPADARPSSKWRCGDIDVWAGRRGYTDDTHDKKLSPRLFRWSKRHDTLMFKGKLCVEFGTEEYGRLEGRVGHG